MGYKFQHMKHAQPVKADITGANAVHVQLLGYTKGDNSDNIKRKSWTEDMINSVDMKTGIQRENSQVENMQNMENMQRVSLCMDVNGEEV